LDIGASEESHNQFAFFLSTLDFHTPIKDTLPQKLGMVVTSFSLVSVTTLLPIFLTSRTVTEY